MTRILIINNSENFNREFSFRIEQILSRSGFSYLTIPYSSQDDISFNQFPKVILTGSPRGNDIVAHHLPYYKWIRDTNKAVLGICAGHHIIGTLFGAELYRSKEAEYGYFYNYIQSEEILFDGFHQKFLARQMHNDSISLPNDFKLLASSERCINQGMKHNTRPLYSLQFHPEYINSRIISNFVKSC